jgi:hypothetical protein
MIGSIEKGKEVFEDDERHDLKLAKSVTNRHALDLAGKTTTIRTFAKSSTGRANGRFSRTLLIRCYA